MSKKTLEYAVRSVLTEQMDAKKQWQGEVKKKPYMGANPEHAKTSPNAQHMEEDEQMDETIGTATSLGGRHNPRRSASKWLAGTSLKKRSGLMRSGNQSRRPSTYMEEVKEKFVKKLSEKKSEKALGKTATGQPGETIDTEPTNQELTGPTR